MLDVLTKGVFGATLIALAVMGPSLQDDARAADALAITGPSDAEPADRPPTGVWHSSMRLGDTLFEKGHYDEAASAYELALAHRPGGEDLANNLYRLATALVAQEFFLEALVHLERALGLVDQVRSTSSLYYAVLDSYVFASIKAGREKEVSPQAMELLAIKSGKPSPWFTHGVDRRLTHRPTGIVFPLELVGLSRASETTLDAKAGEVSVPYFFDAAEGRLSIAVYLVPAGDDNAEDYFKASLNAALDRLRNARRLSVGFQRVTHGKGEAAGHHSLFSYQQSASEIDYLGQLYVFQVGGTIIKYRASYPAAMADTAAERLQSYLEAFDWPTG